MMSAPFARAQRVSASASSSCPKKFGCGTTIAVMSSPANCSSDFGSMRPVAAS
jgi:hypothetical protein